MDRNGIYVWAFERVWLGHHIVIKADLQMVRIWIDGDEKLTLFKKEEHAHASGYSPNCGACKREEKDGKEEGTVDGTG